MGRIWHQGALFMKIRNTMLVAACLILGSMCLGSPAMAASRPNQLLAQYHFAGLASVLADTNAAALKQAAELQPSGQFRGQMLDKLSRAPRQLFGPRLQADAPDHAALFRPLWEELFNHESYGELRGKPGQTLEWCVAVRLPAERAQAWSDALRQVAESWKQGDLRDYTLEGAKGWECVSTTTKGVFRVVRLKSWLVVDAGQGKPAALEDTVRQIAKADGFAFPDPANRLAAFARLPQLGAWWVPSMLSLFKPADLPEVELTVTPKAGTLRSEATLTFDSARQTETREWLIPTNSIRDPIISFTAVQGMEHWLSQQAWWKSLEVSPAPNQLYVWAQEFIPFMTFFAAPSAQNQQNIERLVKTLPQFINNTLGTNRPGRFAWLTNDNQIVWQGLPVLTPFVSPALENGHEFMIVGLFPPSQSTNLPPNELLGQISGRRNLLYYDWEITQARLMQVRLLSQFKDMVLGGTLLSPAEKPSGASSCEDAWLSAVSPLLGNTVTEITAQSSREWKLSRKSHIGLTSLELLNLVRWLDRNDFPLCGCALPPARP